MNISGSFKDWQPDHPSSVLLFFRRRLLTRALPLPKVILLALVIAQYYALIRGQNVNGVSRSNSSDLQ